MLGGVVVAAVVAVAAGVVSSVISGGIWLVALSPQRHRHWCLTLGDFHGILDGDLPSLRGLVHPHASSLFLQGISFSPLTTRVTCPVSSTCLAVMISSGCPSLDCTPWVVFASCLLAVDSGEGVVLGGLLGISLSGGFWGVSLAGDSSSSFVVFWRGFCWVSLFGGFCSFCLLISTLLCA